MTTQHQVKTGDPHARLLYDPATELPDLYVEESVDLRDPARKITLLYLYTGGEIEKNNPAVVFDEHGWTDGQLRSAWNSCKFFQSVGESCGRADLLRELQADLQKHESRRRGGR